LLEQVRAGGAENGGEAGPAESDADGGTDDEDLHEVIPVRLEVRQSTAPPGSGR